MTAENLRKKFLDFFASKGHAIIPSASLIPENDPTTLFTSSGMQPMVPYLLGEKHPMGNRIVNSQKCFRAVDIEEVGNNRHTTMFEMLGNWSLGDYFKKEQIAWMFEFIVNNIKLDPKNLYVTVFRGDEGLKIPRDDEAAKEWQKLFKGVGIDAKIVDFAEKNGIQGGKIFYYDVEKNWWSRSGMPSNMPLGEPGGPDSEMFWDFGAELMLHENSEFKDKPCHVNCDCGRFLEIGNNVFMQYVKTNKSFELLPKGNIDFGGGLERILAAKKGDPDIFNTDLFFPIIHRIEKLSEKKYADNRKSFRIIADHLKAATFIIADGGLPSNVKQGYVLRRLIRQAIRHGKILGIENNFAKEIAEIVKKIYRQTYPELDKKIVIEELEKEENRFRKTLASGLREFEKLKSITGKNAFNLYQTYGFPLEMTEELAQEKNIKINKKEFETEFKKHQELSRTASAGQFKGGLADTSEETKKLHTAAHLMLAALRKILGEHVIQKGSNITAQRLRFDFSHPQKMTQEEIKKVETLVNEQIQKKLPVLCEEMTLDEAKKQGAMGVFESKYTEKVKVYAAGDFSREICGGPHVKNTGELGQFKIIKEEASSAGVRRIKAVLT